MVHVHSLFLLVALFLMQITVGQQVVPRANLYDNIASSGASISIPKAYAPDLEAANFDNRAQSTCVTGIWLFYDGKNYNTGTNLGMEYIFGPNNYCIDIKALRKRVSSIRFAGSPNDYTQDTLTLYQGTYFQGEEEYTNLDLPIMNLDGDHASLIVTGTSGWTLYDRPNYQGNAFCVYPPASTDFLPAFMYDTTIIEIPHNTIKSLRKNCSGKIDKNFTSLARGGRTTE